MGLFDYLKVEVPLPANTKMSHFQTKDLDCFMDQYILTDKGRLMQEKKIWEATPEDELPNKDALKGSLSRLYGSVRTTQKETIETIDMGYTGSVEFYGTDHTLNKEEQWLEFSALFLKGDLISISRQNGWRQNLPEDKLLTFVFKTIVQSDTTHPPREHFISACCRGELCRQCKKPATHKVGEEHFLDDPRPVMHRLTAYLCCACFRSIMGACSMFEAIEKPEPERMAPLDADEIAAKHDNPLHFYGGGAV